MVLARMGQKKQSAVDPLDLKIGDEAPSFALMYAPGKFEFLKNWTEVEGKKLRKNVTQPNRHAVILSFFRYMVSAMYEGAPSVGKGISGIQGY